VNKTRRPTAEDVAPLQQSVGAPDNWEKVVDPLIVEKHEINPGDEERTSVERAFLSTLGSKFKVLKVERIQHLAMWQTYVVKRKIVCSRMPGHVGGDEATKKEALHRFERKWLFHGTTKEVMDKILQQGFNRSFCGKNATAYGKGVYFARDASYSADTTYSVPDSQGKQYVMACRVVVGEYCKGKVSRLQR
jgi:Poly(ADP-ribose) polymerase catalytic domain